MNLKSSGIDLPFIKRKLAERPELLREMSLEDQEGIVRAIVSFDDERYKADAWTWALEQVRTVDEADQAVKPWPDREYLKDLFWALQNIRKLSLPKSRRMYVSWAVATYILHRIRYFRNVAAFIQSETEEKSAYIIRDRMQWIEDNLLDPYRRSYDLNRSSWRLTYATGSYAQGVAQGAKVFRAFTPTIIFMDEVEFMSEGHQSFVAALPFAEKKAQIILCSSSNGPHGVLAGQAREEGFTRFR